MYTPVNTNFTVKKWGLTLSGLHYTDMFSMMIVIKHEQQHKKQTLSGSYKQIIVYIKGKDTKIVNFKKYSGFNRFLWFKRLANTPLISL